VVDLEGEIGDLNSKFEFDGLNWKEKQEI